MFKDNSFSIMCLFHPSYTLPPPRPVDWTMKSIESDKTSLTVTPRATIECVIEHALLKGVTPAMLEWWFKHFPEGTMMYKGKSYPMYELWHPIDHVELKVVK